MVCEFLDELSIGDSVGGRVRWMVDAVDGYCIVLNPKFPCCKFKGCFVATVDEFYWVLSLVN